jgi:hypothetical protein
MFRHVLAPIWDKKKSISANTKKAGLVLNPNKIIKLNIDDDMPEAMELDKVADMVVKKPKKVEIS